MSFGIIDSGLGGYSIYQSLHTHYPTASFVFLADQKHAPYGNRSAQEIIDIASHNMRWFLEQGIHDVIVACNTMNAVALKTLKERFPEITFYDVIEPTLKSIHNQKLDSWLVVGTRLTIQSKMYEQEMNRLYPQVSVSSKSLPELVSLIEGLAEPYTLESYLHTELSEDNRNAQGLILGCTHYPCALDSFKSVFKGTIVDSRQAMVESLKMIHLPKGPSRCFTTGDISLAQKQALELFNQEESFTYAEIR